MSFSVNHYDVDGLNIAWGKTLAEVRPMVAHMPAFKAYGGWPNRRGPCAAVFGLKASEFELRAPHENRPVMQVIYQLAPIKPVDQELHLPYLTKLEKVLGKPIKSHRLYREASLVNRYQSSSVVFSAKWLFDGVKISLSVYSGNRNHEGRLSAAGIFIDWIDEIKAAQPYRKQAELFLTKIAEHFDSSSIIKKFKLGVPQRPFRMESYDIGLSIGQSDELRNSQLALYKKELYPTPLAIRAQLRAEEVAYFRIAPMEDIFISNQWDTVALSRDEGNEMVFWDVFPARGAGYKELFLKELRLEDARNSLVLLDLIAQVEADLKQKVDKKIAYDD